MFLTKSVIQSLCRKKLVLINRKRKLIMSEFLIAIIFHEEEKITLKYNSVRFTYKRLEQIPLRKVSVKWKK